MRNMSPIEVKPGVSRKITVEPAWIPSSTGILFSPVFFSVVPCFLTTAFLPPFLHPPSLCPFLLPFIPPLSLSSFLPLFLSLSFLDNSSLRSIRWIPLLAESRILTPLAFSKSAPCKSKHEKQRHVEAWLFATEWADCLALRPRTWQEVRDK